MGKSNKRAKEALISRFGAECFIDKLHLRPDTDKVVYTGKAQYKRMKQLTYHHIQKKENGGKATFENGAILSEENHVWFNKQTKEKQKEMNQAFQDYKAGFDIRGVTLAITSKGLEMSKVEIADEIKPEDIPEELHKGYIDVESMTKEEYDWLMEKRKKQFAKFGQTYEPPKRKAHIDKEWQREIMQDVIDEMRY